jgi:lipid-A-disaccharide synthase
VAAFTPNPDFLKSNMLLSGKKIVALLPGSRKQEISRLLPDMAKVAGRFTNYQFVIAGAPTFDAQYYAPVYRR